MQLIKLCVEMCIRSGLIASGGAESGAIAFNWRVLVCSLAPSYQVSLDAILFIAFFFREEEYFFVW